MMVSGQHHYLNICFPLRETAGAIMVHREGMCALLCPVAKHCLALRLSVSAAQACTCSCNEVTVGFVVPPHGLSVEDKKHKEHACVNSKRHVLLNSTSESHLAVQNCHVILGCLNFKKHYER